MASLEAAPGPTRHLISELNLERRERDKPSAAPAFRSRFRPTKPREPIDCNVWLLTAERANSGTRPVASSDKPSEPESGDKLLSVLRLLLSYGPGDVFQRRTGHQSLKLGKRAHRAHGVTGHGVESRSKHVGIGVSRPNSQGVFR